MKRREFLKTTVAAVVVAAIAPLRGNRFPPKHENLSGPVVHLKTATGERIVTFESLRKGDVARFAYPQHSIDDGRWRTVASDPQRELLGGGPAWTWGVRVKS